MQGFFMCESFVLQIRTLFFDFKVGLKKQTKTLSTDNNN
jgi:hypothetical protein